MPHFVSISDSDRTVCGLVANALQDAQYAGDLSASDCAACRAMYTVMPPAEMRTIINAEPPRWDDSLTSFISGGSFSEQDLNDTPLRRTVSHLVRILDAEHWIPDNLEVVVSRVGRRGATEILDLQEAQEAPSTLPPPPPEPEPVLDFWELLSRGDDVEP